MQPDKLQGIFYWYLFLFLIIKNVFIQTLIPVSVIVRVFFYFTYLHEIIMKMQFRTLTVFT